MITVPTTPTALEAIQQAYQALQRGEKRAVRHWAEVALAQDAALEEPWLLLAAVATPRASVEFLQRALQDHPDSERARKGLDWALQRLRAAEANCPATETTQPTRAQTPVPTQPVRVVASPAVTQPARVVKTISVEKKTLKWGAVPMVLSLLTCLLIAASFFGGATPVRAFLNGLVEPPQGAVGWAAAEVAKSTGAVFPTITPLSPVAVGSPTSLPQVTFLPQSSPTATFIPTQPVTPAEFPIPQPTDVASELWPTPLPTDTPAPQQAAAPAPNYESGKLILVDISEQHMYVYENETLVYSFVVSTGMNGGTRAGTFSVLNKIPNAYGSTWNIWMPNWLGIYWSGHLQNGIHALPILPNGQRLWAGYLGTPISYGCVVLGTYESELLYNWAEVGTPVVIQY